jgi:hypothetical protein
MERITYECDWCSEDIESGFYVRELMQIKGGYLFTDQIFDASHHICAKCFIEKITELGVLK